MTDRRTLALEDHEHHAALIAFDEEGLAGLRLPGVGLVAEKRERVQRDS
ncbi:MAG: hypothetical protein IPL06_00755 [Betaproteobacteria bacterium]|nr:hypothetical protein [Betaproteobacteria bacterium]